MAVGQEELGCQGEVACAHDAPVHYGGRRSRGGEEEEEEGEGGTANRSIQS